MTPMYPNLPLPRRPRRRPEDVIGLDDEAIDLTAPLPRRPMGETTPTQAGKPTPPVPPRAPTPRVAPAATAPATAPAAAAATAPASNNYVSNSGIIIPPRPPGNIRGKPLTPEQLADREADRIRMYQNNAAGLKAAGIVPGRMMPTIPPSANPTASTAARPRMMPSVPAHYTPTPQQLQARRRPMPASPRPADPDMAAVWDRVNNVTPHGPSGDPRTQGMNQDAHDSRNRSAVVDYLIRTGQAPWQHQSAQAVQNAQAQMLAAGVNADNMAGVGLGPKARAPLRPSGFSTGGDKAGGAARRGDETHEQFAQRQADIRQMNMNRAAKSGPQSLPHVTAARETVERQRQIEDQQRSQASALAQQQRLHLESETEVNRAKAESLRNPQPSSSDPNADAKRAKIEAEIEAIKNRLPEATRMRINAMQKKLASLYQGLPLLRMSKDPADREQARRIQEEINTIEREVDGLLSSPPAKGAQASGASSTAGFEQPTEASINKLKSDPSLRDAFDHRFGSGAAARYLGQ